MLVAADLDIPDHSVVDVVGRVNMPDLEVVEVVYKVNTLVVDVVVVEEVVDLAAGDKEVVLDLIDMAFVVDMAAVFVSVERLLKSRLFLPLYSYNGVMHMDEKILKKKLNKYLNCHFCGEFFLIHF